MEELDDEIADRIDKQSHYAILKNKYKRNFEEKKQYYSMIEFITKSEEFFYIFFPIFVKIIKDLKQENNFEVKKLLYTIIETAKNNNIRLTISMINNYKYKKEDLLVFNDVFGPLTENCLCFTKEQINVIFIDKVSDLKLYGEKYFNSENKYIGFDSEWVSPIKCKEKTETSIAQLSDYNGKIF